VIYHGPLTLGDMTIGWHLIAGTDLTNVSLLAAEAQRLANLLGPCVTPIAVFTDFKITLPDGSVYYQAPLATQVTGTHSVANGMQQWFSTTVAFIGVGNQPLPGTCHGRLVSRLHNFGALLYPPGSKFFAAGSDAAYNAFITNGLNASTYLPADFYGQQGEIKKSMPVQWNEQSMSFYTYAHTLIQTRNPNYSPTLVQGRFISILVDKVCAFWGRHKASLIPFLSQLAIAALEALVAAKSDIDTVNPPGPA